MKKLQLFCMAAVLTAIFSLPAMASIYIGNYTTTMPSASFSGKVSISDNGKMRTESGEYVMITRCDKKVSWALMPSQKTYTQRPLTSQASAIVTTELVGQISRKNIGNEIVNNIDCEKFKVTCKTGKIITTFYQWISADYPFPLKASTTDGKWSMELSQIQVPTQTDSIFEIPEGFSNISQ